MTEEASVPIFILCVPENEVTEVIRKRLDQKGIPFCILPVGPHFAPPHLPEACGTVLIPLCRELVRVAPVDTLRQLQQKGATFLPLGREDARSLWSSLTVGMEEAFAGQEVFQLEDLWEKHLSSSDDEEEEDAAILPIFPHTQVNRETPLLQNPLVDLNLPEPLPSPPIRFHRTENAAATHSSASSRTLIRWLVLFLSLSVAMLLLALWRLLCPATAANNTPPPPAPTASSSEKTEDLSSVSTEEQPKEEDSSDPAPASPVGGVGSAGSVGGEESEGSVETSEASEEEVPQESNEEQAGEQQGEEDAAPSPSPKKDEYRQGEIPSWNLYVSREAENDDASTEGSSQAPPSARGQEKPKPHDTTTSRKEERHASKPQAASNKQRTGQDKKKEKSGDVTTSSTPRKSATARTQASSHYCPSVAELRKAKKGGNTHALLVKGKEEGCLRCTNNLEQLLKNR